jgi:hypothetical protein
MGRLVLMNAHMSGNGFQTPVVASRVTATATATSHPVLGLSRTIQGG